MSKNWKKFLILMVSFLFLFIIIPTTVSILTSGSLQGSDIILVNTNKENKTIPIGREGQYTFQNEILGNIPNSLFKHTKTGITTIGVEILKNEKMFVMRDNSAYGFIGTYFCLSNITNYQGSVETICYMIPTGNVYWYSIMLCPNQTAGKEFIRIDLYMLVNGTIRIEYRWQGGIVFLINIPNLSFFLIKIDFFLYAQLWFLHITDLESSYHYDSVPLYFRGQNLGNTQLQIEFYSSPVQTGIATLGILVIDSSFSSGFYTHRLLELKYITLEGYFGQKSIALNLFPTYSDNRISSFIIKTNFTFRMDSKNYIYIQLQNATIITNSTNNKLIQFSLDFTNITTVLLTINILSFSNNSNSYFTYIVEYIINYTLFPLSLFELYLSASIPLALIAMIPTLGYKIGQKNKNTYWFTFFITILTVIIWRGVFLTIGGIIAIASALIILITKFREEK